MLYSANYLTHLNVMRRNVVEHVGGWRPETDGAQDWDLFLRVTEIAKKIIRVHGVGYHWRLIQGSTSTGLGAKPYAALAQLRTVESRISRLGLNASVAPAAHSGFHVQWNVEKKASVDLILFGYASNERITHLLQSIIKDAPCLIKSVSIIRDIRSYRDGEHFDLGQITPFDLQYYNNQSTFNDLMHQAWRKCRSSVVVTLNASTTQLAPNSLKELIGWTLLHPEIAYASALLLTEHDVVLEAGRILGDDHQTLPLFYQSNLFEYGIFGSPLWYRNVSAVSINFSAFKRLAWDDDERIHLSFAETMTHYCSQVRQLGYRGLVNPYARAYFDDNLTEDCVEYNASFARDPYFHPEFESFAPLRLKRN